MDIYVPLQFEIDSLIGIIYILISVVCGLGIRFALSYSGQNWANAYHYTIAYALLPAIAFVVTKIISGNIALSLGMIGALSIVRFRNPVKNPLELVIYFGLITIGIACSVRIQYGILLTFIIIFVLIFVKVSNLILKKYKFSFLDIPDLSFNDGNNYNTIEVVFDDEVNELNTHKNLVQYIVDYRQKTFIYRFSSKKKQIITNLVNEIKKNKNLKNINVNFIN